MSSVKQILTNAYDPVLGKETNLLEEHDSGLMMIEHSCTAALITYKDVQEMSQKKFDEVKDFKRLVLKARQLKKDEHD